MSSHKTGRINAFNKNFSYQLEDGVAKADWPELANVLRIPN